MIARRALRIINCFGRLSKPKISKVENIFELMRDKSPELNFISTMNDRVLNTTKFTSLNQMLSRELGVEEKKSKQVAASLIHGNAYSPIWMKPYRFTQKVGGDIVFQDKAEVEIPYHPTNRNLKFHYSINQDVPNLTEYSLDKWTAYVFNLPVDIDEKELTLQFGYQQIKRIKIHYCMLGLPAYAVIEFNSDRYLAERRLNSDLEVKLGEGESRIFTEEDQDRLKLDRRQLVLKGIPKDETPASMLRTLSQFGRVMHLDVPTEIYKEPSIKQIKQLYKNQRNPIRINLHRANGTIQSEYYPPFEPTNEAQTILQQKQEQYRRKLRHCQNVDVEEEGQGQIRTKSKGFCIVTFSCQQQAQNCYLQLRKSLKMQLLNEREHFQFDEKHREALLRFIDSSYIGKCLDNDPTKQHDELEKKHNSVLFQSLYMSSIYEEFKYSVYHQLDKLNLEKGESDEFVDNKVKYMTFLNELKLSVGQGNLDSNSGNNKYGKSFDELAEQQLYGKKLEERLKNPRYVVNIDDYIRQQNEVPPKRKYQKRVKKTVKDNFEEQEDQTIDLEEFQDEKQVDPKKYSLFKNSQIQQLERIQKIQPPAEGKKKFSTMKATENRLRKKTLQQKIRSHMLYNKFVRDTINQYMGIFPTQKLQAQFYRKKPTFVNPQGLKFKDGTEFITEEEVKSVLQHSSVPAQNFYDSFVKENEIVKSLNIDVEEAMLRDFEDNDSELIYQLSDVGIVKEEFNYDGNDFEGVAKNLNFEAEFGEQYQVVESQGKKKIVKIAKLEHIMPVELQERFRKQAKQFENSKSFDPKKKQIFAKYSDFLWNGQPVPDEFAEAFGYQKGKPIDAEKLSEQLCRQNNITKKDLERIINLKNYTEEQLNNDYSLQLKKLKAREKRAAKKASDFAKDPSQILVKDRNNKSVVSKFRQV